MSQISTKSFVGNYIFNNLLISINTDNAINIQEVSAVNIIFKCVH